MKIKTKQTIKILISCFFLYVLAYRINFIELKETLDNVSKAGVLTVVVGYLLSVILNAVKWHVLLPETELPFLIGLSFRAQLYATILPGQLFGEASKITSWTARKENITEVTASVVFDKITGIIGQIIVGAFGIYASAKKTEINNKWLILLCLGVVLLFIYCSKEKHVSMCIYKAIAKLEIINKNLGAKVSEFYEAWQLFSTQGTYLGRSVILGMINQIIGIFTVWYLATTMGMGVGLREFCWILPLMSFILLLPISFAGIGLRDASLATMLSLFDVQVNNSLILSMAMLLGQIAASGIGAVYILISNIRQKNPTTYDDREHL